MTNRTGPGGRPPWARPRGSRAGDIVPPPPESEERGSPQEELERLRAENASLKRALTRVCDVFFWLSQMDQGEGQPDGAAGRKGQPRGEAASPLSRLLRL